MSTPSPATAPAAPDLKQLGLDAAGQLHSTVRETLGELFGVFLRRMPAAMTAASKTAATAAQQSACLKLARSISNSPDDWKKAYLDQVEAQLSGKLEQESEVEDASAAFSNDESMAMAGIELRAETLHQKLVAEVDTRFDRLRRTLHIPIYTRALAPAGLCRALQAAADSMNVPARQRGLLFGHFEEVVLRELHQLYQAVLETLSRISVGVGQAAKSLPQQAPDFDATLPRRPAQPSARPDAVVDNKTVSMLESHAVAATPGTYSDGSLAADLLSLTNNEPLPGLPPENNWVPLQRMKLAGDYLNDAVADPFIPPEFSPQHESVRFPLVKSALTDATLFTAVTHPLRSLVNELMLKAASSRITGSSETRRMAELLQQVLVQFDLAPDFVREAMLNAQPIPEDQIKKFFDLQRQQAQERRETVINQAKRMVIQELEQYTFGRGVPEPALRFLNSAWGPLLVKRLLQNGADHPLRKEGLELMEQLLDMLDVREPAEPPSPPWLTLLKKMGEKLAGDGLPQERVNEALRSLEAARRTPRS